MAEPQMSWEEAFHKLPPDAQARVQGWIGTQMFLARELGLEKDAWFEYLAWAFRQPFDYGFLGSDGADLLAQAQDQLGSSAEAKKAAAMIGAAPVAVPSNAPPADPAKARKAGLANIHMLGGLLDKTDKTTKKP